MRLPCAVIVFAVLGCDRSPPAPLADPKAFHEQMEQLNKDVLRQEGRHKSISKKRP